MTWSAASAASSPKRAAPADPSPSRCEQVVDRTARGVQQSQRTTPRVGPPRQPPLPLDRQLADRFVTPDPVDAYSITRPAHRAHRPRELRPPGRPRGPRPRSPLPRQRPRDLRLRSSPASSPSTSATASSAFAATQPTRASSTPTTSRSARRSSASPSKPLSAALPASSVSARSVSPPAASTSSSHSTSATTSPTTRSSASPTTRAHQSAGRSRSTRRAGYECFHVTSTSLSCSSTE